MIISVHFHGHFVTTSCLRQVIALERHDCHLAPAVMLAWPPWCHIAATSKAVHGRVLVTSWPIHATCSS